MLSACRQLYAQAPLDGKHYADSLSGVLEKNEVTDNKAMACFLLSEYYLNTDSIISRRYLDEGQKLATGNKYLSALYYFYSGLLREDTHPPEAEKVYLKADSLLAGYHSKESLIYRSRCWSRYAYLQKRKDDHKKYVDILLNRAIPLAAASGDSNMIALYYLDVAIGFKNMMDYTTAESYLLRSIATLKHHQGPGQYLASAYHTLAEDYSLSGKIAKAGPLLDSMKMLLLPYPDADAWLDYYAGHTMYLTVSTRFGEALVEVNKGTALAKQLRRSYPMQRLLMQKFYVLFNQSKFIQARDVMLDLLQYKEMSSIATNRIQMYYGLALTCDSLHDMQHAYMWMSRYAALSDSVNTSRIESDMNALKEKYEAGEKERKIALLQSENRQAALKAKNARLTNWLLIAASAVILTAFGFLFYYFRNNKKLAQQKEINYQQQLSELEQKQQLFITQAMLDGEERERERIARDLHDGLGGLLAGVRINLAAWMAHRNDGTSNETLHKVIGQLDNSVSEMRRIARNMMPESLLKFGLETAIKDLCEYYMRDGLHIEFQPFQIEKNIPLPVQLNIYRIIQEILSNAVRHSGAKNILVQCSQSGLNFFITIEDDGKGFHKDTLAAKKGMGLDNVKNRVEYLKGRIELISHTGDGTAINIELNLQI